MLKPIKDFPNYFVSKDGKIYSEHSKKYLKFAINNRGYMYTNLYNKDNPKGKKVLIHRLVAETFLPNLDNLPEVNHIDGNKNNNCVENLEWTTRKGNMEHAMSKGLTPQCMTGYEKRGYKVVQYDENYNLIKIWRSLREIEAVLGYGHGNIAKACVGKYKQAYGYHWKYEGVETNRDECNG